MNIKLVFAIFAVVAASAAVAQDGPTISLSGDHQDGVDLSVDVPADEGHFTIEEPSDDASGPISFGEDTVTADEEEPTMIIMDDGCAVFHVGKKVNEDEESLFDLVFEDELRNPVQHIVVRRVDAQSIIDCNAGKNEGFHEAFAIPGNPSGGDVAIVVSVDADGIAIIRLPVTNRPALLYADICFSEQKEAIFDDIVTLEEGTHDVSLRQVFFGTPEEGECIPTD